MTPRVNGDILQTVQGGALDVSSRLGGLRPEV